MIASRFFFFLTLTLHIEILQLIYYCNNMSKYAWYCTYGSGVVPLKF